MLVFNEEKHILVNMLMEGVSSVSIFQYRKAQDTGIFNYWFLCNTMS